MNRRRLYRCRHDRRLAGVAAGVAEYFDLDPTLVRVLWIVSVFFGGFTLLLYIAMAIIVPMEPEYMPTPGPWQPGSERWGMPAGSPMSWAAVGGAPGATSQAAMTPAGTAPAAGGGGESAGTEESAESGASSAAGVGGTPDVGWAAPAPGGWGAPSWTATPHRHESRGTGFGAAFFGIVLILFGALALVDTYLPAWADHGRFLWPAFILGIGVLLVASAIRRRPREL